MSDGLTKALRFIRELQKIDPSLSIACVHTLLIAAKYDGRTIGFILRQSVVSKTSVSRHIQDLGAGAAIRTTNGKAAPVTGHGLLLAQDHPEDRREKVVFLTVRGRALAAAVEDILRCP